MSELAVPEILGAGDNRATELVRLEQKQPGLGSFVLELEATNVVRAKIEKGEIKGNSREAFEQIWKIHTGETVKEKALAFAEGGSGYNFSEWTEQLEDGRKLDGAMGKVRLIEGMTPMLFEAPDALKEEIATELFRLADAALESGDGGVYVWRSGMMLQTFLNWAHVKKDGNGRSTEDWMVWWEKEVTRKKQELRGSGMRRSPAVVGNENEDVRAWFTNGMRYKFEETGLMAPAFLKDEYTEQYLEGRQMMQQRTMEVNGFRRGMYSGLAQALDFQGKPEEFEAFLVTKKDEVVELFRQCQKISDLGRLGGEFSFQDLGKLLYGRGQYTYQTLEKNEVIQEEKSEVVTMGEAAVDLP